MKTIRFKLICLFFCLSLYGPLFSQNPWTGYDKPSNILDILTSPVRCFSTMTPVTFNASVSWTYPASFATQYNGNYFNAFSIPLVGDMDGDGKPEIICLGIVANYNSNNNAIPNANKIVILNGDGTVKKIIGNTGAATTSPDFPVFQPDGGPSYHGSPSHMAIAKLPGEQYPCIILTTSGSSSSSYAQMGKIWCYQITDDQCNYTVRWKKEGNERFHYNYSVATPTTTTNNTSFRYPMPHVADLNGDGSPELLVYNKIYDLATGTLVATTEADMEKANVGRKWFMVGNGGGYEQYLGMMSVADFNNDGLVEIAAGNKIYRPKLVAGRGSAFEGTCDVVTYDFRSLITHSVSTAAEYYYGDGFTAVGDINGDGQLDVIVFGTHLTNQTNSRMRIYAWTPDFSNNTGTLLCAQSFENHTGTGFYSMPFVGDIDGNRVNGKLLPEVCFISGYSIETVAAWAGRIFPGSTLTAADIRSYANGAEGNVWGLTYDESETNREIALKVKWVMKHDDSSLSTGMTVFDFNNSGIQKIVYQDEHTIRVIDASVKDFVPLNEAVNSNGGSILMSNNINSYTGYEYPVIADVNGDNAADFICYGSNGGSAVAGRLVVFEGQGAGFAGAPPVWNQFVYFPTLVNDNLSINSNPMPITTSFNGEFPYNGTLLQLPLSIADQTTGELIPIVYTPDAVISDLAIIGTQTATQTQISFKVANTGDAAISLLTPVSIYQGTTLAGATKVITTNYQSSTTTLTGAIYPNEASLRTVSFNLSGDFRGQRLWVVLSNDGTAAPTTIPASGYYECEPADNYAGVASVIAVNDTYSFTRGEYRALNVLNNDFKICDDSNTQILVVNPAPSLGMCVVNGSTIAYRAGSTNGTDVISYKIVCEGDTSNVATATVTISGSDPAVTAYRWNGSASADWGNTANWTPAGRPNYNSAVVIPSNCPNYPDLKETDLAICKSVKFEAEMNLAPGKDQFENGAEIAKPMYLTYTTAQVELVLPRDRWNMISPPLRDMYSGDYVLDGTQFRMIPATIYAKDYASSNLNPGASGATWSIPHNTLDAPLGLGTGLAIWVDYSYDESHTGGKFVFPSDSTLYHYYGMSLAYPMTYNKITGESGPLTRTNAARFIYEGALSNPLDTTFNMPVAHGMDPSYTSVMLGNPLMSHIDYVQLRNNNPGLGNSFNIMSATNVGGYAAKDRTDLYTVLPNNDIMLAGGSVIPGFKIPPMQSFLATRNGSATFSTVAFGPSVSVTASTKLRSVSSAADEMPYFNVRIDKDGSYESAITIMYMSTASNGFVNNEDAMVTINQESTTATLYSRVDDGTATGALVAFNMIGDLSDPVELGVRSRNGGTYRFNFYDMNLFSVAREIWLEDKGNTDTGGNPYRQNMMLNPAYDFNVGSGYTNNRFFIHFGRISTGVEKPAVASNISIFAANDRVTVASPNSDLIQQVEVLNLQGQTVAIRSGLNLDYLTMTLPAMEAVYIVKVTTQKSQKTQKVFIK